MILLDSNIVIYAAEPQYKKLREWLRSRSIAISELTKLEVLGYHRITEDEFEWFSGFFDNIESIPISTDIIESAIPLRRSYKMSLGDSVIAASALYHNLDLCTNNQKDFERVENLQMIDIRKYL
jgi:predicted nucleic acid-binding protein